MNFDADKKTIATLLNCKKRFEIPRFQREYSWEKAQLKEFFNDILTRISIDGNGNLTTTEYFWGSTLFVGSFTDSACKSMLVVDGQQRLTTITIFLSCIRKAFLAVGNSKLAEITQSYIMSMDDNGDAYAILVNETPYPFFQNTVQAETPATSLSAISEEEQNIKNAVDFFISNLDSKNLRKKFKDKFNREFELSDIYKVLRDQLLNSVIITISTQEKEQANMIFEILNAKGKSLDQLDLIKNQIFSVIKKEAPSDEAKTSWQATKDKLNSRKINVDMSVFFNHYWASKYGKTNYKKLYDKFKTQINKDENTYRDFLEDLNKNSEYYVKITNPSTNDFNNKVEYRKIYYFLSFLNDLNIRQSRILILVLYDLNKLSLLSSSEFNKCLSNLCIFHLIFNGLYSQGTNVLEKLYADCAIALRLMIDKATVNQQLNNLYVKMGDHLRTLIASKENLIERFAQLKYSAKTNLSDNIKSKFFVRMLYETYAAYPTDASLEHIANENGDDEATLLIGNIIPLEITINNGIPANATYKDKIKFHYSNSSYPMMEEFIHQKCERWNIETIKHRSIEMATRFYDKYMMGFSLNL